MKVNTIEVVDGHDLAKELCKEYPSEMKTIDISDIRRFVYCNSGECGIRSFYFGNYDEYYMGEFEYKLILLCRKLFPDKTTIYIDLGY